MAKRRRKKSTFSKISFGKRRLKKFLSIAIFIVVSLFGGGLFLPGKVMTVADGDTLSLITQEGKIQKIRLYGVDCPESGQAWGAEAKAFTRSMTLFKNITVQTIDTDQYGRAVAIVKLPDGRTLNEELIKNGHAWVYTAYCKIPQCTYWKGLERKARATKAGLWQHKNPQAPWNWRRQRR